MTTAQNTPVPAVPVTLPVPEGKLKELRDTLIKLFPAPVPGSTREVDPQTVQIRDYAAFAMKYWETQHDVANLELRRQLGDAETGTVNGVPVITRKQHPVAGHWVSEGDRDYLRGASA